MLPDALLPLLPRPGGIACRFDTESATFHPWGTQDSSGTTPVTPQTRFPIASLTKTFTAHLLLEAVRERNISLLTPLRALLPGFTLADPAATRVMTLEDALCHHSGLPPHTWAWVYGDVDRQTFIRERLPFLESVSPHRAAHQYSNILYAVLGQVIDVLTGSPWEQALQEEILRPLEMRHTGCLTEIWATQTPDPARPHDAGGASIPPFFAKSNHLIAPASEMISTAEDLARWGQRMLELSPDADRWRVRNTVPGPRPFPDMGPLGYGLGWRVEHTANRLRVWHSGQCSGYSALLALYPEQNQGGVYLCNASGAVPALHAIDLTLHTRFRPGPLSARSAPSRPPELRPARDTALPEGVFHHPGYGSLKLTHPDGVPHIACQTAPPVPVLQHPDGTLFFRPPGYESCYTFLTKANALLLHLEPVLPPIRFEA
ncbi:MAG: beta-lactamase family protein [Verrucomicrobia bacterium]|nr:beta-lactamase family protein [Verrucomicrobiota bacterium]MCH8525732.1 beta-lactamase family protein [Kiritimatiellia bacterium]